MHRSCILGMLGTVAALSAQSFYVPNNNATTGSCNTFPFNTSDMRYQALFTAADLCNGPAIIRGMAFAQCATGVASYAKLTIRMAHLSAAALSTTFDANLAAGATTVLDTVNYKWSMVGDVWNDIDLQTPFIYVGAGNVVVDCVVLGRTGSSSSTRRDATNHRVYVGGYTGQLTGTDGGLGAFKIRLITGDATTWTFGTGCVGSNSQIPALSFTGNSKLGSTLGVNLANALASKLVFLNIGTSSAGPIFPFDMALFSAPGCMIYHDGLITVGLVTTTNGTALLNLGVPNDPGVTGLKLYFQFGNQDPAANGLGLTTSNYGRILVGV